MKTQNKNTATVQLNTRQLARLERAEKQLAQTQTEIHTILQGGKVVTAPKVDGNVTASGRPRNKAPLHLVILKVTKRSPKTLMEILEGVKAEGYKFKSVRETHSVGAFLYGKRGKTMFTQTKDGTHRFFPRKSFLRRVEKSKTVKA